MAYGAEVERVLDLELRQHFIGEGLARPHVPLSTKIIVRVDQAKTELLRCRVEHLYAFGKHLGSCAVPRYRTDLELFRHGRLLSKHVPLENLSS